jgi:hypothetical protein
MLNRGYLLELYIFAYGIKNWLFKSMILLKLDAKLDILKQIVKLNNLF